MTFNLVQFNNFQSNFHPINSVQLIQSRFILWHSIQQFLVHSIFTRSIQSIQFSPDQFHSIQFNIIHIQITRLGKIKIVINNYRVTANRAKSKSITGEYTIMIYGAKSTTAVMMMKAKSTYGEEPLMMMAKRLLVKRPDVACCCW